MAKRVSWPLLLMPQPLLAHPDAVATPPFTESVKLVPPTPITKGSEDSYSAWRGPVLALGQPSFARSPVHDLDIRWASSGGSEQPTAPCLRLVLISWVHQRPESQRGG